MHIENYINHSIREQDRVFKPFVCMENELKDSDFERIRSFYPALKICNTYENQLEELFRVQNPHIKKKSDEYAPRLQKFKTKISFEANWIFYPWRQILVKLLPEEAFVQVRTSRNQYKITPGEQQQLMQKKVGVMGLSVGQTIAITIAMERGAGELRLADFDELELSNLNRLRCGIHALGLQKTTITAREIAEVDPYIKVKIFEEGITESNLDQFLLEEGKLDVLVDECDSLNIKIRSRQRARELGIPVIMDTSDRGMLDVERFDLHPERPVLHGLTEGLNPDLLTSMTDEEKIPYVLRMIGVDDISKRMKMSMLEVEQSIPTWPQLASSVFLGGAMAADVMRRMLLNQHHDSGRFYVDFDEILPGTLADFKENIPQNPFSPLSWDVLAEEVQTKGTAPQGAFLSNNILRELVDAACWAPSGGNMQPWKWIAHQGELFLFHEKSRSFSFLDYEDAGTAVAFGAAFENMRECAATHGYVPHIREFASKHCAHAFHIFFEKKAISAERAAFIRSRHTHRLKGDDSPLHPKQIKALEAAGAEHFSIFTQEETIRGMADAAGEADRIRLTHPWGHQDFVHEIRWDEKENQAKKDGVDLETLELKASDKAALQVIRDREAVKKVAELGLGTGLIKMSRDTILKSAGIGVVYGSSYDFDSWFTAGEILQRIWLEAARQEICFQPISPLTFMLYRWKSSPEDYPYAWQHDRFKQLDLSIKSLFDASKNRIPLFVFRLFQSDKTVKKSLRLPLDNVFYSTTI